MNETIERVNKVNRVKIRIFETLGPEHYSGLPGKIFNDFLIVLISLNIVAVILGTVEYFSYKYSFFLNTLEIFSIAAFTIEYFLRLWTCTIDKRFENPITGRIRFAATPLAIVDLMAFLPFYLPVVFPLDLRFIRILRLFRIFRFLKLDRYYESLETIINVLKDRKEDLTITVFAEFTVLIFGSSLMYFVEHDAQPEKFSSILSSMWWGIITMTTVGYGDVYPVTPLGKFIGSIVAVLGIGLVALPAGILASGFAEEIKRKKEARRICPHCGEDINER